MAASWAQVSKEEKKRMTSFPSQAPQSSLGKTVYKFPNPVTPAEWEFTSHYKYVRNGEQAFCQTPTRRPRIKH